MGCCWEPEQGKVQGSGGDHDDDDGEDDDGAAASRQRLLSASVPGTVVRFSRTLSFEPHWDPPKQRLPLSLSDRGENRPREAVSWPEPWGWCGDNPRTVTLEEPCP